MSLTDPFALFTLPFLLQATVDIIVLEPKQKFKTQSHGLSNISPNACIIIDIHISFPFLSKQININFQANQ